jgi:hypothetical protein
LVGLIIGYFLYNDGGALSGMLDPIDYDEELYGAGKSKLLHEVLLLIS